MRTRELPLTCDSAAMRRASHCSSVSSPFWLHNFSAELSRIEAHLGAKQLKNTQSLITEKKKVLSKCDIAGPLPGQPDAAASYVHVEGASS
jgi:hypothetical protein